MFREKLFKCLLATLIIVSFLIPQILFSEDKEKPNNCMDKAIDRIIAIRSMPELKYLHTLDGKDVALNEFHAKCYRLYPKCSLFSKFYYWQNEIKEIVSATTNEQTKYKIRCYFNCLTTFCSKNYDPRKTHGDVAEFYDSKGNFMGLATYMGDGKYCPLAYDGYRKCK